MRGTTKQKRKRKLNPGITSTGRVTGKVQYTQSNRIISTIKRMMQYNINDTE